MERCMVNKFVITKRLNGTEDSLQSFLWNTRVYLL